MPKSELLMFVEPGYGSSTWFAKSSAGLRAGVARREMTLEQLRQLSELKQYPQAHSAVLIGASQNWTRAMIQGLRQQGVKPVLVGCSPQDFGDDVSGPVFDRRALVERMVAYFVQTGRKRLACVGNKWQDANDELRKLAFLSGAQKLGLPTGEKDVFGGSGPMAAIVNRFLDHAAEYDGALCVNDQVAVHLMAEGARRGVRVPEDLFVAGSGSCIIGSLTTPTLTTSTLDYYQMGLQAVNVCHYLERNPDINAVCVTLPCQLICRGSTAFVPEDGLDAGRSHLTPVALPGDSDFEHLDRIENCLLRCDALDFGILRGMLMGHSAETIAAELYVAHGTVSYRAKKLYQRLGVPNRQAFLQRVTPYLTNLSSLDDAAPGRDPHDLFSLS